MSTTDVDRLQAELAKAEARAEAARRKAEEAAEREAERRAEREKRFDHAVAAVYDEQALTDAVTEAQRALERALDADPLIQAFVALRAAQGRRHGAAILYNSGATRLGLEPTHVPSPGSVDPLSALVAYVERKGAELVADDEDAFHSAREEAASE